MSGQIPFKPSVPALDMKFNAADAEIILRSSDGVDLAVHKFVLQLSSPVFRDLLSLPQPPKCNEDTTARDQAVIHMTEDAQSLRLMLCFCYPRTLCPEPDLLIIDDIKRAATLAQKYDIGLMRDAAETALVRFATNHPDIAYAVAWRYEYPVALRITARRSLEPFVASPDALEWDEVPASSVFKLLRYQNSVPAALEDLLNAEYNFKSQSVMSWIDPSIFTAEDYLRSDILAAKCTCKQLLLRCIAEAEKAPESDSSSHTRPLRLVREWWWLFIRAIVTTVMRSDRPPFDDAVSKALPDACKRALDCPECRLRDIQAILEFTTNALRAEIEKRLENIPLGAPFM
ncbi:hypothetical protein PENSPDRAFT_691803 [Peniophora sp. CONT]|nr:hypothetical protein PENSPDRAFT_691803 [Peniophora sp. CONT]